MKEKITSYVGAHERSISALACMFGFALDSSTLPSIDHTFTRVVSVLYFTVVIALLFLTQAIAGAKIRNGFLVRMTPLYPLVMQFLFGGLFSVVFVYYFRSSTLAVSWPLTILLGLFLVGNEIWKKRLERVEFQIAVLFILFLFFSIFTVPLLFGTISTGTFMISVGFSIAMMGVLLLALTSVAWGELKEHALKLFFMLAGSATLVVAMYFANILPPIPLVAHTLGAYHSLVHESGGDYLLGAEAQNWKQQYFPIFYPSYFYRTQGEAVYFYTAVYAPTDLHAPIVHLWQYWDANLRVWTTASRIEFPISGGREEGYRGYSLKQNAQAGLWRVLVQTLDGRTISQKKFIIIDSDTPAQVTTITL